MAMMNRYSLISNKTGWFTFTFKMYTEVPPDAYADITLTMMALGETHTYHSHRTINNNKKD